VPGHGSARATQCLVTEVQEPRSAWSRKCMGQAGLDKGNI